MKPSPYDGGAEEGLPAHMQLMLRVHPIRAGVTAQNQTRLS